MRKLGVILALVVLGFGLCEYFIREGSNLATGLPKSEYDLERDSSLNAEVLSPSTNNQREPAVYDDKVVWAEYIGGYWQIILYDLSTKTRAQLTDNSLDHVYPSIFGNTVIWWEGEAGGPDRMAGLNCVTFQRIDLPGSQATRPKIGTSGISWIEGASPTSVQFFSFSDSQTKILSTRVRANWPSNSGSIVVWRDSRQGNNDIYGYDLIAQREFPIAVTVGDQDQPDISGDIVVWQDNRRTGSPTNFDIYGYNIALKSEFVISARGGNEVSPKISGNYVVWTDYVGSYVDVYAYDLSNGKLITVAADGHANSQPAIFGSAVVWSQAKSTNRDALSQIAVGQLPNNP